MIKVEGLKEAQMMLKELGAGQWSKNVLKSYGDQLKAKSMPYAPKPPNSKYKRTNNLLRGWYSTASQTQVEVVNRAWSAKSGYYSGYVQQRATQAWFHRQHGWVTIEDRADSVQMDLFFRRKVDEEVAKIMRKYA
jgi:hypothetical protein